MVAFFFALTAYYKILAGESLFTGIGAKQLFKK